VFPHRLRPALLNERGVGRFHLSSEKRIVAPPFRFVEIETVPLSSSPPNRNVAVLGTIAGHFRGQGRTDHRRRNT
jgi:hypothetical protein